MAHLLRTLPTDVQLRGVSLVSGATLRLPEPLTVLPQPTCLPVSILHSQGGIPRSRQG